MKQSIINYAATNKKPSKRDAFAIVSDLIETTEKGETIGEHDLARLYAFFNPPATKKALAADNVAWVNSARSKDKTRYYLSQSYSDGENLVATDGHRLHMIETELSAGYCNEKGEAIDLDGQFPEYQRVIPETNIMQYSNDLEFTFSDAGKTRRRHFTFDGIEYAFNEKYWQDATIGMVNPEIHFTNDSGSPILIAEGDRKAVIMPMRF